MKQNKKRQDEREGMKEILVAVQGKIMFLSKKLKQFIGFVKLFPFHFKFHVHSGLLLMG